MTQPSRPSPAPDGTVAEPQGPVDQTLPRGDTVPGGPPADMNAAPNFAPPQHAGEIGQLGRYRVLKELGRGGMGAVYLGHDGALDRKVALKVMLPKYAADRDARERFLREARTAAMVKSDHVVTIHDVGEERGIPFIAMEYLLGHPLDKYLKAKGELPLAHVLRIGRETALGLAAAHDLGLVHRDIKPGNLWLEAPKGRVKLLDFGLARAQNDDVHLTHSGAVIGTPAYMSPEQGRGLKVDHRSDLFSLGVMLYRLCTGTLPFTGGTTMALLTSLAVDTPTPVRQLNPDVPEGLEAVVNRLLAKDPADRFQTAMEVVAALRDIEYPQPVPGELPIVVPLPVQPLLVGAQTQNVWEGIVDSESVPVPMATSAETEADAESAPAAQPHRPKPRRKVSKWPAILAGVALLAAVAGLAAVMWPKKKPEVVQGDDPNTKQPGVRPPTPSPKDKDKGTPPAKAEGTVYPLPADLIAPMTPVKPAQVFTLDHLDPANPKHIAPEEKYRWQPPELVAVLGSHRQRLLPGQVNSLAVSPDGKTVLGGHPIPYHAIDIATGRLLDWPLTTCFSPDGTRAASYKKVWQLADPNNVIEYPFQGEIMAFLTEDIVLVGVEGDHVVWKLDPKEPKPLARFDRTHRFTLSNDRKYLAVGFRDDSSCQVFDITAEGPKKKFVLPGEEGKLKTDGNWEPLSLSDTGLLATLDPSSVVRVWDVAGPKPQLKHTLDTNNLWGGVRIFPKGDRLVRRKQDEIEVWSVEGETPRKVASVSLYSSVGTNCMCHAVTPDGNTVITGHLNGAVVFWGIEKGVIYEKRPLKPQPRVHLYADFSPDGRFALLYNEVSRMEFWNFAEMAARPLEARDQPARFAPDGASFAVYNPQDKRINVFSSPPGAQPLLAFGDQLVPVCYSPDGKWLATGWDGELAIWDVSASPPKELPLRVPYPGGNNWQFTPDGRYLVAARDGGAKVWAMTTRGPELRQETTLPAQYFALSPDGKTAAICHGADGTKYYALKEGVLSFVRPQLGGFGSSWADFSPDSQKMLVGSDTGLKVFDVTTGKEIWTCPLRAAPIAGRFHPDGKHVFVTNADGTTYVLRLPKEVLEKLAAETADRKAAEYVLSVGGFVCVNGVVNDIKAVTDLPKEPFQLTHVAISPNASVTDAGLASFKGCKHLIRLALQNPNVTDEGLVYFKDCKNLTGLFLNASQATDTGLANFKECKNLTELHLGAKASNAGLAHFKDCGQLVDLWLYATQVSDEGLVHLKGFNNLRRLTLSDTRVGNDGLVSLKDCGNLTSLTLLGTLVTDAGLASLKDCKNLTLLDVRKTKVTPAALAEFAKAQPQCKIIHDGGTIEPTKK